MIIKGDLNGDGRIDIIDLMLEELLLTGVYEAPEAMRVAGDINNNGEDDIKDLYAIKEHLLGKLTINEVVE